MNQFIPLSIPNFEGNEKKYVNQAIDEGWVSTGGKMINDFEAKLAEYVQVDNAVAVQSGTAGLHLALKVVGVQDNDEVIVPTLTFIAAVNPVKYCNAYPVFMDCDDSLCIDVDKVEEFITTNCKMVDGLLVNTKTNRVVKAVVAVHIFGNMCNMEKLLNLAKLYNLKIVEDSTEALGSFITTGILAGKRAGTIGDIGVYSFNGNKIITTGGGGMIVTNNKEYADKCRYLSQQAKDDTLYFIHNEIGYNYRMTNLQAGLGLGQLETLDKFIKTKQDNYNRYISNGISLLPFVSNINSNHWFYSYLTDNPNKRDELIQYLSEKNIQSRPIWALIHDLPPYKDCESYKIEKASFYHDRIVNIPCSTSLKTDEVDYISNIIKDWE